MRSLMQPRTPSRRQPRTANILARLRAFTLAFPAVLLSSAPAFTQNTAPSPGNAPASLPAGTAAPHRAPAVTDTPHPISPHTLREAEDTYLRGARDLDHKNLLAAEAEFSHAAQLNPQNRDYTLAVLVTRAHRVTELLQTSAAAARAGHRAEADALLLQARDLDPQSDLVRQHFAADGTPLPPVPLTDSSNLGNDPWRDQRSADVQALGGPIDLLPAPGTRTLHTRGDVQAVLRAVCNAFGITPTFDTSVSSGPTMKFDLDGATFPEALRTAEALTHTFAVPQQPKALFFARDTQENRAEFQPLLEETLFIPGVSSDRLAEYANLARNVFSLPTVNAVSPAGGLVLRGDAATLQSVNATFADLVDGGAEVLLDLTLYEVDRERIVNLGTSTPSSVGVFPVAATAENLINANQSLIAQAVANNLITLTSNPYTNALTELEFLIASGTVSSSQFTNLLGTLGHYAGLPLAGVYLGSGSTFNALLNTSDARILDVVQLRAGSGQEASFRAGSRYPIETGIYSSSVSSATTAALAGVTINGVSVASLLGGAASTSVPQIQYEDLGLSLKATPQVQRSDEVTLKLDFKIEALGSGSVNSLPILNNRQLTSQVTIPAGKTVLLASLVSNSEQHAIDGLPFLSELPGFQGTDKSSDVSSTELLITLTPHIVRTRHLEIASRRLLLPHDPQPGNAP